MFFGECKTMKHWIKYETLTFLIITFLISHLLLFPIFIDLNYAFAGDDRAPVISHYASNLGRYGQKMTIKAHVSDQSSIQSVTLVVLGDQKPIRGKMPEITSEGNVPVKVRVRRESHIYSGPGSNYKARGSAQAGEMLQVSGISNDYYKIVSDRGIKGYVYKHNVDIFLIGKAYGVTLPASLTRRSTFTYKIEAVDVFGNKSSTEPMQIRLLTAQEIQDMRAGRQPVPSTPAQVATTPVAQKSSDSVLKKPWFWGLLVAAGVGIYFLLSGSKDEKTSNATVDVLIEWD